MLGRGEELVQRPHPLRARGRQSKTGRDLASANLAASGVDRLGRVARQTQRGRDPCGHTHVVLPEREHAVGPDVGLFERFEGRGGVVVGEVAHGHRKPSLGDSVGHE